MKTRRSVSAVVTCKGERDADEAANYSVSDVAKALKITCIVVLLSCVLVVEHCRLCKSKSWVEHYSNSGVLMKVC